jgi:hypothetical protein
MSSSMSVGSKNKNLFLLHERHLKYLKKKSNIPKK